MTQVTRLYITIKRFSSCCGVHQHAVDSHASHDSIR